MLLSERDTPDRSIIRLWPEFLTKLAHGLRLLVEGRRPDAGWNLLHLAQLHLKRVEQEAYQSWLLEELAALEHDQWAHWTRYMLDNLTPENIARWRRQCETAYADLSEKEKESDRQWARKVLALFRGQAAGVAEDLGDRS